MGLMSPSLITVIASIILYSKINETGRDIMRIHCLLAMSGRFVY